MSPPSPMRSGTGLAERDRTGFTLIELLVSMAVLVFLLLLIVSITHRVLGTWKSTSDETRSFVAVQAAMEALKRQTAQATLNTTWAYLDAAGKPPAENSGFTPSQFGRASELFFLAGPASSLLGTDFGPGTALFFPWPGGYTETPGLERLARTLNVAGYFVKFGSDETTMPAFVQAQPGLERRWRYRLYEVREPAENFMIHADTVSDTFKSWAVNASGTDPAAAGGHARPVADNVILFLVRCLIPASAGVMEPAYAYNSRTGGVPQPATQHQLPPRLEVTLVALDENSAARIAAESGAAPPALVAAGLFQDPDQYEDDMNQLQNSLTDRRLNFRVFRDEIALAAANWSTTP